MTTTTNKKTAPAMNAKNVTVTYARNAAVDINRAVEGMVASESGCAKYLALAYLAQNGGANGADGITVANVKSGLKRAGYAQTLLNNDDGKLVLGNNDIARARPWYYVIGNSDAAETLAKLPQAAWAAVGKALVALEVDRDGAEDDPKKDAPKPVTIAQGITRAKAMVADTLAKNFDKKKKHGQDLERTAKALGLRVPEIEAPAQVEASKVEGQQVEASKVEASKVEGQQVEASKVEASKVEASKVEGQQVDTGTPNPSRPSERESLLNALLAAMSGPVVMVSGALKLPVSGGAKGDNLAKRINEMREAMQASDK